MSTLDKESETFMVDVVALETSPRSAGMTVNPSQAAQIAILKQDEALTKILPKYVGYTDIFSFDLAMELPENTGIKEHTINLMEGKQLPYRLIYSLEPVELKTLKTYIEIHLKNRFIRPFKSPTSALIIFNKKPDCSLWLYINYQGLNKFTIKNQYPLPLIGETLDPLGRAKQFTWLDLASAYY